MNDRVCNPLLRSNYSGYLMGVTRDVTQPFLIDVNVVFIHDSLLFDVTFSFRHMENYTLEQHVNYTLFYEQHAYSNTIRGSPLDGVQQLHYEVDTHRRWKDNDRIVFSIVNNNQGRVYSDLVSCVRIPPEKKLSVVSCSYVSDYNSIAELKSFVAFQRMMNVSRVVFYRATLIPGFDEAFHGIMKEGYLVVVDYYWPRVRGVLLQRNNQQAQMNSCFYRYKYVAEAVINCDVDEYLFSETYPFDIPRMIEVIRREYSHDDMLYVFLAVRMNCR